MEIILASQSPSRKKLLTRAGIPHRVFIPSLEEECFLKETKLPSQEICLNLAKMKAQKAAKECSHDTIVIACDQLAFLKGEPFGKAHTKEKAVENLTKLQGQTHKLIHGLYMNFGEKAFSHISINKMSMRPLTQEQIKKYVSLEKPLKSAGSYLVEGVGIGLFEKIESSDFFSIMGLPLTVVISQLIHWGFSWPKEKECFDI